eukprot:GSChrysophyteH2.ASY1.ANO1.1113.1 assembled CDS
MSSLALDNPGVSLSNHLFLQWHSTTEGMSKVEHKCPADVIKSERLGQAGAKYPTHSASSWNTNTTTTLVQCEHGKTRSMCKDCVGARVQCGHGRQKSRCKDCKGSSVCEHGRVRRRCKDCGAASVCEHGRERTKCKDCGGSQICNHGRQRSKCKECHATICMHNSTAAKCKDCKALRQHAKHANKGAADLITRAAVALETAARYKALRESLNIELSLYDHVA